MNKFTLLFIVAFSLSIACDSENSILSPQQSFENETIEQSRFKRGGNNGDVNPGSTDAYQCIESATVRASSSNGSNLPSLAIDCDPVTGWISGSTGTGSLDIFFDSLRTFSGVRITTQATTPETQTFTVTALKIDRTSLSVSESFDVESTITTIDLDLGVGFDEFVGLIITLPGETASWKSIYELELIVDEVVNDPKTIRDCKKGGWRDFGFKNQGQCIRYVKSIAFCNKKGWKKNHKKCEHTKIARRRK